MKTRPQISHLIVFTLAAVTLVISVFSFVKALGWLNQPFPGFMVYHPAYVGSYSYREWPGKQAGLKYMERIRAVDGQQVQFGNEVTAAVKDRAPGTKMHYTIESKAGVRDVAVPVDVFDLKDFFLIFSINFFVGLAICVLGFVVFILKPNTATSWVFMILCFCVGNYGTTGFEIHSSYHLVRFHYTVLSIFPFTFLHLGLIFPERKRILIRYPVIEYLVYIPSLLLVAGYQVYSSTFPEFTANAYPFWIPTYIQLSSVARVFTLIGFVGFLLLVIHTYLRSSSVTARQRAKMMIFGVGIAFLPVAILGLLTITAGIYFPFNFVSVSAVFFPLLIAYSIVRHNLFDADVIIRRTVGYALVTVIVIGAYAGVSLVLNVLLEQYRLAESRAFPIVFTLVVIFIFNPLRDRIQSLVDRLFFRKEYDYGVIIEKISGAMTTLLDLDQILKSLVRSFTEEMFITTGAVMLLSADGAAFRVSIAEGEEKDAVGKIRFQRDEPLIQVIEKDKNEITRYDLLEDPKYKAVCEACNLNFEALNASLMIPMIYQEQVIGLLSLGDKKSGKSFNHEDVDLLRTIAHQGAVAIENARLFQENLEKQRMEEELNIARDLQMSMLPARCPEIIGFEIAATSLPAREVGGDFYDFTETLDGNWAMVVGDVTGKSVSGALVMSASRSIFRMLSEEGEKVSDIMIRANRRAKKDIKTGMFVALLYAVLDVKRKKICMCSAGQTQPVSLSAQTGKASLLETVGDTFPLGILDDVDYQETTLAMHSGDTVVFYTDGIVEAMNDRKEVFGFDRLIETIQSAHGLSANDMMKTILQSANTFAGDTPQHDDLTVIVLRMQPTEGPPNN
jgi:phosphoserine phosphatase RsbU/P